MEMLQKKPSLKNALNAELHAPAAHKLPAPVLKTAQKLTGYDLGNLRIRYNSGLPGEFGASAMAVKTTILQDKPSLSDTFHEIIHIVQNAQGLVHTTRKERGVELCEDPQLEQDARLFSETALSANVRESEASELRPLSVTNQIAQFRLFVNLPDEHKTIQVEDGIFDKGNGQKPAAKTFVPLYSNDVLEIKSDLLEEVAQRYLELHPHATDNIDAVREILQRLIGSSELDDPAQPLPCEYAYFFADLDHLWQYISITLVKRANKRTNMNAGTFKMNMINVGQGDAILITLRDKYLLVDLSNSIKKVEKFLSFKKGGKGIKLEDSNLRIVITHNHSDHTGYSQNGMKNVKALSANTPIGQSDYNTLKNKTELNQFLGDTITIFEDVNIKVDDDVVNMCKPKAKVAGENSNSLLIIRKTEHEVVILTGDLQSEDVAGGRGIVSQLEKVLTGLRKNSDEMGKPLPKVVLKVPHHGSRENTNKALLEFIKNNLNAQATLLLSSGTHKGYNHPSHPLYFDTTNNSLYQQGARFSVLGMEFEIYYTRNMENYTGSLVYKSSGTGLSVEYTKVIVVEKTFDNFILFSGSEQANIAALANLTKQEAWNTQPVAIFVDPLDNPPYVAHCSIPAMSMLAQVWSWMKHGWDAIYSIFSGTTNSNETTQCMEKMVQTLDVGVQTLEEMVQTSASPADLEIERQFLECKEILSEMLAGVDDENLRYLLTENQNLGSYIPILKLTEIIMLMPSNVKYTCFYNLVNEIFQTETSPQLILNLCILLNVSVKPGHIVPLFEKITNNSPEQLIERTVPTLFVYLDNSLKRALLSDCRILNMVFKCEWNKQFFNPDIWLPFAHHELLLSLIHETENFPFEIYALYLPFHILHKFLVDYPDIEHVKLYEDLCKTNRLGADLLFENSKLLSIDNILMECVNERIKYLVLEGQYKEIKYLFNLVCMICIPHLNELCISFDQKYLAFFIPEKLDLPISLDNLCYDHETNLYADLANFLPKFEHIYYIQRANEDWSVYMNLDEKIVTLNICNRDYIESCASFISAVRFTTLDPKVEIEKGTSEEVDAYNKSLLEDFFSAFDELAESNSQYTLLYEEEEENYFCGACTDQPAINYNSDPMREYFLKEQRRIMDNSPLVTKLSRVEQP